MLIISVTINNNKMSDWIHCNKCFKQPTSNSDKFNLTNCGHFICGTCTSEKPGYCYECESNCSTTLLTHNLSDDIRCYFENIDTQFDQIKKCLKTMEFQKNHRQKYFAHLYEENIRCTKELKNILFKYNAAKDYIKRINGRNEELQKENKRLKDIIKSNMRGSKSSSSNLVQDKLSVNNGHRGKNSFSINNEDFTPISRNQSFFSEKNLRTCSSNVSSVHSTYFMTTPNPSPAINLPFQSLFINSKENYSRKRN